MSEKMNKEQIIKTMNDYWELLKKAEDMVDFYVVKVGLLDDDANLVFIGGYKDEDTTNISEYDFVPIEWFSMGKRELKKAKELKIRRSRQREKEEKEQAKKEKLSNKNK